MTAIVVVVHCRRHGRRRDEARRRCETVGGQVRRIACRRVQYGAELAILQQTLLQLGQYMLAIGELAQRVYVRPYLVHERFALRRLGQVDHLLHHIVGVLVLHHGVQRTINRVRPTAHLFDEHGSLAPIRVRHALLDDVAGELVLRQDEDFAFQLKYNTCLVFRVAMLQHMLYDIVSILILNQSLRVLVQLVEYGPRLFGYAVLEYALDDATPVRMRGQVVHLLQHVAHNEIYGLRFAALDALLDHVVAILVFDAFHDVALEFVGHFDLILAVYRLERLLYHATPVHLQGQRQDVAAQALSEGHLVFGRAELEELLDDVVAEHVRH